MKTKAFLLSFLDLYFISEITGIDIQPINEADKFILKDKLREYQIKSSIVPGNTSVIYDEENEISIKGKVVIPNQYRLKDKFKLNLKQYPELSPIALPRDFVVTKVEDKKNNRKGYLINLRDLIDDIVFIPDWVLDNKELCVPDERFVIN
jgi:hypothetical protein